MGRHRNLAMLIGLALIWGASFLFIKVAVRELTPATLIVGRLGLAALTLGLLVPFVVGAGETTRQLRANWVWLVVVALVNTAIPFWLLSWGETRIDSGLASIIQAAVPIFNALIAFVAFREVRVTGIRLAGVAVGFVGVALLVGAQPQGKVLGALAVVGMAFCYGLGGLFSGRYLKAAQPVVVSFASTAIATLVWLPVGVAEAPSQMPSWKTIGCVVALGVPGTALAYLLFFGLITGAGRGLRVARHLPDPADRARLRRGLPRRALRSGGVRRPRPDPRRRRARNGRGRLRAPAPRRLVRLGVLARLADQHPCARQAVVTDRIRLCLQPALCPRRARADPCSAGRARRTARWPARSAGGLYVELAVSSVEISKSSFSNLTSIAFLSPDRLPQPASRSAASSRTPTIAFRVRIGRSM